MTRSPVGLCVETLEKCLAPELRKSLTKKSESLKNKKKSNDSKEN